MEEQTIDLSALWIMIKKKMNVIMVITLLVTMISGIVTFFFIEPKYTSTVAVFINDIKTTAGESGSQTINDINMYQKLVETYSTITKSRAVAEDAIAKLNLDLSVGELQGMIASSAKGNTQFLNISITSNDRELAYKIANQMALSLKSVSKVLRGADIVQTLDAANVPNSPSSPNLKMNIAIGFMLGLMISVFGVFILEFMDKTVKDSSNIIDGLGLPYLGSLPLVEGAEL